MKRVQSKLFVEQLNPILDLIEQFGEDFKKHFKEELLEGLNELRFMPYKFPKSRSFDEENIRDFSFKEYVIPYFIDKDTIVILAIFKENMLESDKEH